MKIFKKYCKLLRSGERWIRNDSSGPVVGLATNANIGSQALKSMYLSLTCTTRTSIPAERFSDKLKWKEIHQMIARFNPELSFPLVLFAKLQANKILHSQEYI